jgi:predicted membrane channel-forming protein YqfA (hemolysin III family)
MSREWWGFIFLMLIMKVPIVYLAGVVWYACKPPDPLEPAPKLVEVPDPAPPCPWLEHRRNAVRPRKPRPPVRRRGGSPLVSHAYARHE